MFYISAKYYRNIPKGIPVTEQMRNLFEKTKGYKQESQSCNSCTRHVTWSCSTFLLSIIKYSKGSLTYRADIISMDNLSNITKRDNAKSKKDRIVITIRDTSSGPVLHFYQVSWKYSKRSLTNERTPNQYIITVRHIKGRYSQKYESQSCHSCTWHVVWFCSTCLPSIIQISHRVFDWQNGHEINGLSPKIYQREITPKLRKEVSFLYATRRLVLYYMSTKYHKNIPKSLWLTERTRSQWIITVRHNKER